MTTNWQAVLENDEKAIFSLRGLYKKYGYYLEGVVNIFEEGIDGPERIASMINKFRERCPTQIADLKLDAIRDYKSGVITYSDKTTAPTNMPINNMLYLELDNSNGWIAIRPSGTEPKLKLYFGYTHKDKESSKETLSKLMEETMKIIKI